MFLRQVNLNRRFLFLKVEYNHHSVNVSLNIVCVRTTLGELKNVAKTIYFKRLQFRDSFPRTSKSSHLDATTNNALKQ